MFFLRQKHSPAVGRVVWHFDSIQAANSNVEKHNLEKLCRQLDGFQSIARLKQDLSIRPRVQSICGHGLPVTQNRLPAGIQTVVAGGLGRDKRGGSDPAKSGVHWRLNSFRRIAFPSLILVLDRMAAQNAHTCQPFSRVGGQVELLLMH